MRNSYSPDWKSSKKPAKQRKYRANAPLHIKRKFMAAVLNKKLREAHKRRSTIVRVGDQVKILRGTYRGKSGRIEKVDVTHERIYITGIDREKKDGSKSMYPIHPSNVMIEDLNTEDKKRFGKSSVKLTEPKKPVERTTPAKTEESK